MGKTVSFKSDDDGDKDKGVCEVDEDDDANEGNKCGSGSDDGCGGDSAAIDATVGDVEEAGDADANDGVKMKDSGWFASAAGSGARWADVSVVGEKKDVSVVENG